MKLIRSVVPLFAAPFLLLSACDVPPEPGQNPEDFGVTTQAAARTGTIGVIDITLNTPLSTVDDNDIEVDGTIKIYENHGTPLKADSSLDLARIRTTPMALDKVIDLKRRGSSSLLHPKKNYSLDLKGGGAPVLGMPAEPEWV